MSAPQLPSSRTIITKLVDGLSARAGVEGPAAGSNGNVNPLEGAGGEMKKQLLALHAAFPNELLPALDLLDRSLVTLFRIRRDGEDQPDGAAPQALRRPAEGRHAGNAPGSTNNEERLGDGSPLQHPPPADSVGRTASSDAEMLDAPGPSDIPDDTVHTTPRGAKEKAVLDLDKVYYVRSAQQRSSRYGASFDALTAYEVRLGAWNCSCPAFAFAAFPPVHPEPPVPMYEPQGERRAEEGGWSFGGVSLGEGIPPVCKHLLACVLAERCAGLFGGCVEERIVGVKEAAGWAAGWGD